MTKRGIVKSYTQNKNKTMQNNQKPHIYRRVRPSLAALGLSVLILGFSLSPVANAVNYQAQINSLSNQNVQTESNLQGLQIQAGSYQQAINDYQVQIAGIENSIAVNQNKMAADQQQIDIDNQKIAQNKKYLSDVLKTLYVQGSMSTIEQLATSQDLSTFVNKQEDNIKVQDRINSLLTTIKGLQLQAQANKNQISVIVNIERSQQTQLAADENQQNQLLAMNQQQQASYTAQLASNNNQIAQLQAEQIAANRRLVSTGHVDFSGSCGGSYPASAVGPAGNWGCNYGKDNTIDNWGMYNRECVSYTAWMVYSTYGYMPNWGGQGDANEWPADARFAGIPTGSTPKVGSVAIYMGGASDPWGHAMWVKSVNGDGTITVDQYNLYFDGNFYETNVSASGLTYIYFGS